jgi:two-component system response regulator DevR
MNIEREIVAQPGVSTIRPAKLLLARSRHVGWEGLRAILREWSSVDVVGEVTRADEVLQVARHHRPEAILAAAQLEGTSIVTLAERLRGASPKSKLVVFADEPDRAHEAALQADSIYGVVLWRDVTPASVYWCLGTVLEAGLQVASRAAMEAPATLPERRQQERLEGLRLSERERRVLAGLAEGLSRKAIAEGEHLSMRTVARTITVLEDKLGAANVRALVARAVALGPGGDRAVA